MPHTNEEKSIFIAAGKMYGVIKIRINTDSPKLILVLILWINLFDI